jgi:hypothetical protein
LTLEESPMAAVGRLLRPERVRTSLRWTRPPALGMRRNEEAGDARPRGVG